MEWPLDTAVEKESILQIYLSNGWGGLEIYLIRISKEFISKGYKVFGLCLAGTKAAKEMQAAGIKTFEVKSRKHLILKQLNSVNDWLVANKVQVTHAHKSKDVLISALLNSLTARKAFFTEHVGGKSSKKDIYHRLTYRHLRKVFSISQDTYQRNLRTLPVPSEKIVKLWHGVKIFSLPSEEEILACRNALNIRSTRFLIGCVGRLLDEKGQLDLLKAFKIITRRRNDCELFLVGSLKETEDTNIPFVKKLEAYIQSERLTDKVSLLGYRSDIFEILTAMDITCIPSHNEAFGLTAIEAMSSQKAIVASNSGALP